MLSRLNNIKPYNFFVVVAILFEIVFNIVTPPLQAPDEISHFYRAYQIADGHFLPERTKDRLGGHLPVCFDEFVLPYTFAALNLKYTLSEQDVLRSAEVVFDKKNTQFKDFPSTTTYSAVSYLPQITALFIIKQFNCKVATLYYGGRIFSFLFWLIIMYFVIRIVPLYKWLFTIIILLPMNLYVANAFSADGVNNCLTFLFVALILKHIFSQNRVTTKDILVVFIILALLALAKFVFVSFILLLFLIPGHKFKSHLYRFGSIAVILVVTLIIFSYWSGIYLKNYIKISDYDPSYIYNVGLSPCADPEAQKAYILDHGFYFFSVIYHSIFDHPQTFLKGYVGAFGQSDIFLPKGLYILSYLVILFIAVTEYNKMALTTAHKILFSMVALAAFVLILLSIHLMWDCVGEGVVDLVQGRYLIPVLPLLFILPGNKKFGLNFPYVIIVLPLAVILNACSARAIYKRFYTESYISKTEFFCDMEKKDDKNYFSTSDPKITLWGGTLKKDTCFNGSYSGQLSPPSPYGLEYGYNYKFNNLKYGDLVEIDAWLKGDSAYITLTGTGKGCKDLFITSQKSPITKNGWRKVYLVCTVANKCDSMDASVFLWNQSRLNVYFDDLKFSIKKFN